MFTSPKQRSPQYFVKPCWSAPHGTAVELTSPLPEEIPLLSVEIRDLAQRACDAHRNLSPVNKRETVRGSTIIAACDPTHTDHLLEIDLLRQGERLVLRGSCRRRPITFS